MRPKPKERRVYYFLCGGCGKRRQSFKRSRARREKCRDCRTPWIDPRQRSMFPSA